VEADILADGRIDFEEYALARLDFVIASIHSRFNMTPPEMTARMLAAMDNRYLTIIGHPTGRLLLSRDPYGIDLDAIIEKAAANGIALEINADPHRLDLDWRVLRRVRAAGVMVSIGADAHNLAGIGHVEYGVGMARKGWLGPDDILNARSVEDFTAFARRRR
jgi:DNA polymerase (family 10)